MLMSHLAKSLVIILQAYPTGSHLDVKDHRNGVVMKAVSGLSCHALPSVHPENLPSAGHEEPSQQNPSSGAFPGPRLSSAWYLCHMSALMLAWVYPLIISPILRPMGSIDSLTLSQQMFTKSSQPLGK